jgi:hypothetical protein
MSYEEKSKIYNLWSYKHYQNSFNLVISSETTTIEMYGDKFYLPLYTAVKTGQ